MLVWRTLLSRTGAARLQATRAAKTTIDVRIILAVTEIFTERVLEKGILSTALVFEVDCSKFLLTAFLRLASFYSVLDPRFTSRITYYRYQIVQWTSARTLRSLCSARPYPRAVECRRCS